MIRYQVRELLPSSFAPGSPETIGDWLRLLREGLPSSGLATLLESLVLSRAEFCAAMHIPEHTQARHLKQARLSSLESEKVLRVARVWVRAIEVFDGEAAARDWLKASNPALENAVPLSMLVADIGAEEVLNLLGRIEHGVFN